jgi:DNA-binding transcriptional regulator YiaG
MTNGKYIACIPINRTTLTGDQIRTLREKMGMDRTTFAKRIGVSDADRVRKYEEGKTVPRLQVAARLDAMAKRMGIA